ncbi:hypothetical protein LBMAG33_4110 [Candidatus Levyibacteriota bacterium]|nr:hypothetical protein LBMAG33_4110 [Candidatus Levybacteria bacterium]
MQKTPFGIIVFFFFCLFIYTKFIGPIPFFVNSVQTTKTDFFKVQGTGEATAVPNTAVIVIGITKSSKNTVDAQKAVNIVMNTITKDLKNLGLEDKDIKTINYSINPDYDSYHINEIEKQKIKSYSVAQEIEIKIKPIEKAEKAIDIATKNGANIINGARFILDDKTIKELQEKAQKKAISNAKLKAESLATATGLHLGKIIDVQIQENQPIFAMKTFNTDTILEGDATNLNPGENKIEITITLSYELR